MNKEQKQQIVDYYSTTDKYIHSKIHSNAHQSVSKTYSFPKSYISYCKPRTVSTEQREWARQMMIERNKAKEN